MHCIFVVYRHGVCKIDGLKKTYLQKILYLDEVIAFGKKAIVLKCYLMT